MSFTCYQNNTKKRSKLLNLFDIKKSNKRNILAFPIIGLISSIWILIRVIPKPSRAAYPCIKVAAPLASTFFAYIIGLFASIFAFRKARERFLKAKYIWAVLFIIAGCSIGLLTFIQTNDTTLANPTDFEDPLGSNNPIGEAKGVFPGRVVWIHDPDATNENCEPTKWNDGYFMDKNCDQNVVDDMLSKGLQSLTGTDTDALAWEAIFKYFNLNHEKGDVGYQAGERIFIKINSVHVGNMNSDYSIRRGGNYGFVDTSPHAVHALLKQLVYHAGVAQDAIYVGDPFRDIFKHCHDKWHSEFPDIHYISQNTQTGRDKVVNNSKRAMYYSDRGTVLDVTYERFYNCVINADYIINLPAYKGHRWGGVTFFAKNHFGSHTRSSAAHLHKGLHRTDYNEPLRDGYRKYRVFVDIMGNEHLGGKTLLYLMDGLWGTSYEHDPPVKFQTAPFNNDWSSSLFLSLDPVAIASVCLDVMQAEFTEEDLSADPPRYTYVHFDGIDDYLHQAADSSWWPDGMVYDPENDGTQIGSLGVHEHWNNPQVMQYTRNLGTGEGIELITIFQNSTDVITKEQKPDEFVLSHNYPNPFNPETKIRYALPKACHATLDVFDISGRKIATLVDRKHPLGHYEVLFNGHDLSSGFYAYRLQAGSFVDVKQMVLLK